MARRVSLLVLSVAAAVGLAFVSQTGWVDADGARLLTVAAVVSGVVAIGVLGLIAVKDHLLERLAPLVRLVGRAFIWTGQRMTSAGAPGPSARHPEADTRPVKEGSDDSASWKRAALTFGTWLYRRDEWAGLSQEARVAELAPAPYLRKRLNHLGLSDLTLQPRRDIGPEPWWEPPTHSLVAVGGTKATCSCGWHGEGHLFNNHAGLPQTARPVRPAPAEPVEEAPGASSATTHDPVAGVSYPHQENAWLPDPNDLTQLALTKEDLEAAWAAAVKEVHARLAPDANLHFRYLGLLPMTYVAFHTGSAAAARIATILVYPDLSTSLFAVERVTDPLRIGRGPFEPEWRRDETWAELIRLSWIRERPFTGSVRVEWIGHGYQSWMPLSEWKVVYERIAADGTKEQTTTYGLVEGRELIEEPQSSLKRLAERFPPPEGQGLV